MESLKRRSTSRSGLASGVHVKDCIYAIAKDNRLKLAATGFSIALENPRGALKDFKKSAFDDLDCLTKTIDRLETDLDGMRLRANAWAIGDVAKMRTLSYPDQAEACHAAVTQSVWM